jgi:hypothetical protein
VSQSQPPAPKLFVIAFRCGRLANRLVLFANFIAFAEEHGSRVMNFTFHSYAHFFETTRRDIYCQYPVPAKKSWLDVVPGSAPLIRATRIFYRVARAASLIAERLKILGPRTMTLREIPGQNVTALESPELQAKIHAMRLVFVYGWKFRAPDCVQRQAEKIRAYFRPTEEHDDASREAVQCLRQQATVVIGVHIRQGDYAGWRGGKYFFPVSQYANWMLELAEQFPEYKVAFLVCSDGPRKAEEFPGLSVAFGPGIPVQDLYALAQCDYIMGPVSSFSQWASFYGNKPLFHLRDKDAKVERGKFSVSYLGDVPG